MDEFEQALQRGLEHTADGGIGTLGERTLHAALKLYMDADETHHERPVCGCVADIFDGKQVTEIQTGGFSPLGKKLPRLLPDYPVTVVHPLVRRKRILWIDPETGEVTPPRRSPRVGRWSDALPELYYIRRWLNDPHLSVLLLMMDMDEWRRQDGWGSGGKRGAHRVERLPVSPPEMLVLEQPADYAALLPEGLPPQFTAAEFAKAARLSSRRTGFALTTLRQLGVIAQDGKRGRAYVYRVGQ